MGEDKTQEVATGGEDSAVSLQKQLTEQLDIFDWVPEWPWTVDAIRVIHAVQVRGAVRWQFDASVGTDTLDVIKEVCDHMQWFFQTRDNTVWITDYDDFVLV